jgi:phosphoribosylaminoimidazole-succinocarboxamide synthase
MAVILETNIPEAQLLFRGKVRDIYDLGENLMLVATDRLSAFDVVLPDPIPHKGQILTQISNFWFERFKGLVENHLVATDAHGYIKDKHSLAQLHKRAIIVKKAEPLAIEVIVRGYLAGSGWLEYQRAGTICGIKILPGLQEASRLPKPIFTPSTKAPKGQHDENISPEQAAGILGADLARQVERLALELYKDAAAYAETRGIILCDTKFEFGLFEGKLILIDEVLTPDSSRFWPRDKYQEGSNPPSYDKQYVRDFLTAQRWDKKPPAPQLPLQVIQKTTEKYIEAYESLTGARWSE